MNYICAYYDIIESEWHYSKRVKKKEAEHLMHELLNFYNEHVGAIYIFKIVKGEICDRNFIR